MMWPRIRIGQIFMLAIVLVFVGCGKDDVDMPAELSLLGVSANGASLRNGDVDLPTELSISLTFSASLDQVAFQDALEIRDTDGRVEPVVSFANGSSKAILDMVLEPEKEYHLTVMMGELGANGQRLKTPVDILFTTGKEGPITSMPPCVNAGDCVRSVSLQGTDGAGTFDFYSNYPVYEENARWEDLTQAVIVVHGISINPDDYYGYMTNTLEALSLSESTVLIAPFFRTSTSGADDFYWSDTGWREGKESRGMNRISSFQVLDELISRLADTSHFPVLDQIIITGQSSGGLFTHLFAPANRSEGRYPGIRFDYLVSESQYFYYPDGQRIDESTGELYTPGGCTGYDLWPLGFEVQPAYVTATGKAAFDDQFVKRGITYILGNGSGTDNSLNTTDCAATLLGPSRYLRGEAMFRYMELRYPGQHHHKKVIVPGVMHDGRAVYQSATFRTFLLELLQ